MLLRGATTATTAAWCTQARYTVHTRTLRTAALAAIASQQQKQLQYLGKAQFVTSTAAVCNARHPPRRRRRRTKRTLGSRDGILAVDRSSLYPVEDSGEGDGAAQQDGSASSAAAAAASKQNMKHKTPDTPILEDLKAMVAYTPNLVSMSHTHFYVHMQSDISAWPHLHCRVYAPGADTP